MSRYRLLQSWVGSHENEPDYCGEQIGNRNAQSKEISQHFTKSGGANTAAYSDDALTPKQTKAKKKPPIASRILPQNVTLNRIDQQEAELREAYQNKELPYEEFEELLYVLTSKRERAIKSIEKALKRSDKAEAIGQPSLSIENDSTASNSLLNSGFQSMFSSVIENNVKKDAVFFFTGVAICFTLLLYITN